MAVKSTTGGSRLRDKERHRSLSPFCRGLGSSCSCLRHLACVARIIETVLRRQEPVVAAHVERQSTDLWLQRRSERAIEPIFSGRDCKLRIKWSMVIFGEENLKVWMNRHFREWILNEIRLCLLRRRICPSRYARLRKTTGVTVLRSILDRQARPSFLPTSMR